MKLVALIALTLPVSAQVAPAPSPPGEPAPTPAPPVAPSTAPAQAAPAQAPPAPAPPAPAATAPSAQAPPAPTATTEPAPAAPAPATEDQTETAARDPDPLEGHILDATGYLLPARTVELGLYFMGYGITDWLNVGTYPAVWVAGPLIGGTALNLSVKTGVPITRWVNVGLEANGTWLSADQNGSKTRGYVIPVTLGVSANASESQNYSLALRYIGVRGQNDTDLDAQEVEGAAITRLLQTIVHGRYRFTDTVGLYARGYLQLWTQNIGVDSEVDLDEQTTVDIEGEAVATDPYAWSALAGVHLRWTTVNLRLGLGYGNFFLPRISFAVYEGFFPDLDFYVRF